MAVIMNNDRRRSSSNSPHSSIRADGFTLIECLAGLAVLAIIVTAGVPAFNAAISSWRLTTAANETLVLWQLARIEAIKSNKIVVVCGSANNQSESPSCSGQDLTGWIAFIDRNGNRSPDPEEELLRYAKLPRGVRAASEAGQMPPILFHPDGMARPPVSDEPLLNLAVLLCLPDQRIAPRRVAVRAGSSMTAEKIPGEFACPTEI